MANETGIRMTRGIKVVYEKVLYAKYSSLVSMLRLASTFARPRALSSAIPSVTMPARRSHTYTEDPAAPPMLRYQASLPPLPVPSLPSTLAKYIESVEPLLTPAQLAHTKKTADEFLASPLAATLQARLHERAAAEGDNWLSKWWNEAAYMGYRDPVVVFVSYFFVHVQDRHRTNGPQAAAALVKAMLPFREMVVRCVYFNVFLVALSHSTNEVAN